MLKYKKGLRVKITNLTIAEMHGFHGIIKENYPSYKDALIETSKGNFYILHKYIEILDFTENEKYKNLFV